jgi:hypothetical protein
MGALILFIFIEVPQQFAFRGERKRFIEIQSGRDLSTNSLWRKEESTVENLE